MLDWILARQSGEETSTPVLDYFLDFATDNTLFGPTTFVERVVNRATTFFFSELLRVQFDSHGRAAVRSKRESGARVDELELNLCPKSIFVRR